MFGNSFDVYINEKVFKGCANSGMYMGPSWKICIVLDEAIKLEKECFGDDQRALNIVLNSKKINYEIDVDAYIFKNLSIIERLDFKCSHHIFVSEPGEISLRRFVRAFVEYLPFFQMEIFFIIVVIIATLILVSRKKKDKVM